MSKFTNAMNAAKDRSSAVASAVESPKLSTRSVLPTVAEVAPQQRRGRPAGKRSSETTIQVTAYIESTTHVETKIRLLQNAQNNGEKQDFSGLGQHLLSEWLKSQK